MYICGEHNGSDKEVRHIHMKSKHVQCVMCA